MSNKNNLKNNQILKEVNSKSMDTQTLYRLYKYIKNMQQISKFDAKKLINLINKKTKEIPKIKLKETANKNTIKTYHIDGTISIDIKKYLKTIKPLVIKTIQEELKQNNYKSSLVLHLRMSHTDPITNKIKYRDHFLRTKKIIILQEANLNEIYNSMKIQLMERLEKLDQYPQNGSGWRLNAILGLDLEMDKYKPLRGSSYIKLLKPIMYRKATINIQNNVKECFKWSVLAALHHKEIDRNHERVNKDKQWEDDLNFDNIIFPVAINDIKKFEKQNNLKINVFGLDNKLNVYPIKNTCDDNAIDLLFISNNETNHYC